MKIKGRSSSNNDCKIYAKGKLSQSRKRQPDTWVTSILQLVHTDQAGPIEPADLKRNKYTISFTDDFSGAVLEYFTKIKVGAALATNYSHYDKIKTLRSDNGLEFKSNDFQSLLRKNNKA